MKSECGNQVYQLDRAIRALAYMAECTLATVEHLALVEFSIAKYPEDFLLPVEAIF